MRVAAQGSAFSFRGSDEPPASVAAKLGVAALLRGSARREGGRVHVALRLIDPRSAETIWSEERDFELSDLYAVRGEIAQAVAGHLLTAIPAALGDLDTALPALRKSFEERDGVLFVLQHYPAFRPVRHDPRFQQLVVQMGLPA